MAAVNQGETSNHFKINTFRLFLSFFFFLYTYVVAKGLIPLPDQTPRINFFGVFCVSLGLVIAYHCLTSSYRLFLFGTWLFIPLALKQLTSKIKFLEMMLEPYLVQRVTYYGLVLVLLVLISPPALRLFNRSAREYKPSQPLFLKNGLPF